MSNLYCSPNAKNKSSSNTCYNNKIIEKVVDIYNKKNKTQLIKGGNVSDLIPELENHFGKQKDWDKHADLQIIKDDIKSRLVPNKPQSWSKDPWLSTIDILNSLKQYDDANPDFKFIGPTPIDFDHKLSLNQCVENDLCNIDIEKLVKDGIRKIGVVFNLDKHTESGSHWVSMFIDLNHGSIYYFDSVGTHPPPEIEILSTRIAEQGNRLIFDKGYKISHKHDLEINFKVVNDKIYMSENDKSYLYEGALVYFVKKNKKLTNEKPNVVSKILSNSIVIYDNNKQSIIPDPSTHKLIKHSFTSLYSSVSHQKGNNECGIYSIHFIINMVNGGDWEKYIKNIKNDKFMKQHRDIFFRPQN